MRAHRRPEEELAAFLDTEECLLFDLGWLACTGALPALAGPGAMLFCDRGNRPGIADGCRLAAAEVSLYATGTSTTWPSASPDRPAAEPGRHRRPLRGRRAGAPLAVLDM